MDRNNYWVGVDLDGTLAEEPSELMYPYPIGRPIHQMLLLVKGLISCGIEVRVFTGRVYPGQCTQKKRLQFSMVRRWLTRVGLPGDLKVTAVKDPWCVAILDNIAHNVVANTGYVEKCSLDRIVELVGRRTNGRK